MTTKDFLKILLNKIELKNSWGKNELKTLISELILEYLVGEGK